MEDIRNYTYWARTAQKWISRELAELRGTNDRKRISELFVMANASSVGIGQVISEDGAIERIESDTSEELSAERAMWEALNALQDVADAVEAELNQGDDAEERVDTLSTARKKVAERWFGRQEAS